jgi:hypothetical protein
MATDASGTIYVGRVKFTADQAAYAAEVATADGPWLTQFDTRRLKPPYQLFLRFVSVGTAVTTTALQAKLQHTCVRPAEEGIGGVAKVAIPATAWKDAEESTTAIETTDIAGTAATETSNVLTEQLGDYARVLLLATSGGWQTGIYVDVWLKGSTA